MAEDGVIARDRGSQINYQKHDVHFNNTEKALVPKDYKISNEFDAD